MEWHQLLQLLCLRKYSYTNKWAEFDEDEKEALQKPMLPASSTPGSTFTASIIMTMKMAMTAPAAAVEAAARTEKNY